MTVEKLIAEYQSKVDLIDKGLEKILELTRKARHGDTTIDVEDLREERANADSKRQIYIQFMADLETLQDN